MDSAQAIAFIKENARAVLATRGPDGSPQLSPIVAAVDDDGRLLVSTRETAYKTKNVRRDPKVSFCFLNPNFFGEWVYVHGAAEIVSLPEAMELLVDYYRTLSGEHPDWDEYRASMEKEQRVVLRITPTRAGPDQSA